MALVLKLTVAAVLAAAAFWTTATHPVAPHPAPADAAAWLNASRWPDGVLDTLTLDEAVGQLVVARVRGEQGGAALRLVSSGRIGGIVVPEGDLDVHLRRLDQWQEAAPIPLLVSTENTGSLGLPLTGTPRFPSPLALGAARRADLAYMVGRATAEAARTVGVQSPGSPLRLAPGSSPFGDSSVDRTPLGRGLVRGLREGGVLPAAVIDGPGVSGEVQTLVNAGLMEIRLRVGPSETAEGVADLVHSIRDEHHFNGLLVIDVEDDAEPATIVRAVAAGADQVMTGTPEQAVRSLAAAARAGQLDEHLDRAARRVLSVKAWAGLAPAPAPLASRAEDADGPSLRFSPWRPPSASLLHRAGLLRLEVARQAVTVIQAEDGPLPLVGRAAPRRLLAVLLDPSASPNGTAPFASALLDGVEPTTDATVVRLGLGDHDDRYASALADAERADLVVLVASVPNEADDLAPRHRAIARGLLASGKPVVLVVLGPPSGVLGLPRPDALVTAFGAGEAAQRATAEAVFGQIGVDGRLPVPVAGLYAAGSGERIRQQALRPGVPEEAGLDAAAAGRVDAVMREAVRRGAFPGGAVAIGRDGVLIRLRGYGTLTQGGAPATESTPYDLASLTKVVGTTAAVMRLVEDGEIDLDAPVARYLPDYAAMGKDRVTVRQLLNHSAGHRPFYPFYARGILDRDGVLAFIYADTLQYRPGSRSVYSDFDMIVLAEVVEAVTGNPLDQTLQALVFDPLGMHSTGFRRPGSVDPLAAPTERDRIWRGRTLQGEVHDEAASVMGGVAGHAGLFSTAEDLSRFAFLLASGGEAYGARLFRPSTLDLFTRRSPLKGTYPMGLGWMLQSTGRGYSSAGSSFGARSFGHTGFTGTSIWVDPAQNLFVVLLSNRVHPTRENRRIREVRAELADAVASAVLTPPGMAAQAWGFGPVPDDLLVVSD